MGVYILVIFSSGMLRVRGENSVLSLQSLCAQKICSAGEEPKCCIEEDLAKAPLGLMKI